MQWFPLKFYRRINHHHRHCDRKCMRIFLTSSIFTTSRMRKRREVLFSLDRASSYEKISSDEIKHTELLTSVGAMECVGMTSSGEEVNNSENLYNWGEFRARCAWSSHRSHTIHTTWDGVFFLHFHSPLPSFVCLNFSSFLESLLLSKDFDFDIWEFKVYHNETSFNLNYDKS